jgi:integrator complex subunit 11
MEVLVLGAGHDVGRSCVVVTLGDKRIMFDCGMHIGYKDSRRFPDFTKLTPHGGSLTSVIDAVVITHFHLDHCGALPHMTEVLGYDGPIYMTAPTAAICPSLLEDFRHLMTDRRGEPNLYTSEDITACMRKVTNPTLALALAVGLTLTLNLAQPPTKVTPVALHERVHVSGGLSLGPYYAGHVLGAAMFHADNHGAPVAPLMYCRLLRSSRGPPQAQWPSPSPNCRSPRQPTTGVSVLYTGDFNTTPDRHLGPAHLPPALRPDLLITESTYANTVRESKRSREREFLMQVHETTIYHPHPGPDP